MKKRIKIHPAILVDNTKDFDKQVEAAFEYTDHIDVDIIDWDRTDTKTITAQDALSVGHDIKMTFDLMVDHPADTIDKLIIDKRVDLIILNIDQHDDLNKLIRRIKTGNKNVGIALNPNNEVNVISEYYRELDFVQIFLIEPGSQRQPFISEMLNKITELREMGYEGMIGVDGSVNEETVSEIKNYDINVVSVGSALSKSKDPKAKFKKLKKLLK